MLDQQKTFASNVAPLVNDYHPLTTQENKETTR
jgi:hypothetical protein